MFRMKKQEYKEQERHYYFFDYLFWLGEITWEHYHKVSFKQPRGSDMLWACITFFIFMPVLTIGGHFLDECSGDSFSFGRSCGTVRLSVASPRLKAVGFTLQSLTHG